MSEAKLTLSLDEIIKNNKKTGAGKKFGQPQGLAAKKRQAALLRRQKTQQKGAAMGQNRTPNKFRGRGQIRAPQQMTGQKNLSAFATQKLVQTLVKKALRQGQVPVRGVGAGRFKTPNLSVRQRVQLPRTPVRAAIGRGRGGFRGRVALRVGGRGRGGLKIGGRGGRGAAVSTGVHARLGFVGQKDKRLNLVNQRRGLNLQLTTSQGKLKGRGGMGRMASDQLMQEQIAQRRQQQLIRQQRQQQQRTLTVRGRGGRFATRGSPGGALPRIQLVSPSRRMEQQQQQFVRVGGARGGRRGRGRVSFGDDAGTSGFGGDQVRGVRASFSNSQTGTTLNDRFGGGRQQVRVGLKQQRGRGGFRGGRRQVFDY